MGFWPFGANKKNRKRALTEQAGTSLLEKSDPAPMARNTGPTVQQGSRQTSATEPRQQNEEKTRKLSKPRPPSQKDSSRTLQHSYTGTPRRSSYLNQNMSQTSIGPENFTAIPPVPTLYARRHDYDPSIPRKKSSKRKADHVREREVKAMTEPMPIPKPRRPATYSGSGPLQRETVDVRGDFRRPPSQVSLPIPENISEMEDVMYQNSFKIGLFAALSPRPTVKYNGRNRGSFGKQPARLDPVQQSIEEEDLSFSKRRIDDLADNLDSAGLRELLERDQERRLRKRETDKQKLHRKLQKRAEKEQEEKTRRARAEEFARTSSANLHEQQQTSSERPHTAEGDVETDPFADPEAPEAPVPATTMIRNPFEDEKDVDLMQDPPDPEDEPLAPPIPVQSPRRKAATVKSEQGAAAVQGAISPPSSPIAPSFGDGNMSQLSFKKEAVPVEVAAGLERDRRASENSAPSGSLWTSFFRRGSRRNQTGGDRGRTTPSEFSNTSRESFARKQALPHLNTSQRTFRRTGGAAPQRTMSKFREDLPELPLSPPDSRMQSPEAPPALPIDISARPLSHTRSGQMDSRSLATSSSIPTLDRGRDHSRVQSLLSGDSEALGHALSQSLASVDSEGSWLSGKPVKRLSGPLGARHIESAQKPDEMEEVLAGDEYLNRLSADPEDRRMSAISSGRRPSSTLLDMKAEQRNSAAVAAAAVPSTSDVPGETWHAGIARQPTVIKVAPRAKSREGLLKDFRAADVDTISSDEEDNKIEEDVQLMRARSVDYGKGRGHARQISAGSAKVLDIRRGSQQYPSTPTLPSHP